jgi:hypothetical protein
MMSPDERISELCELLALGLMRLKARKSSKLLATRRTSSVHFASKQSGPVLELYEGESAS